MKNYIATMTCLLSVSGLTSAAQPLLIDTSQQSAISEIREALAGRRDGAAMQLVDKKIQIISPSEALQAALDRSPSLLAAQQDVQISEANLQQQQSAYDWTLGITASYVRTDFNERSETITRERSLVPTVGPGNTTPEDQEDEIDEDGAPIAITDIYGDALCITVAGEIVNPQQCALQTSVTRQEELASGDADATNSFNLGVTGSKLLAYGAQLELGVSSQHRTKNFFALDDLGLISALSADDPLGNGSRYPWTSKVFAEFTTPVPFGKNYGADGALASFGIKLSHLQQQKSQWIEKQVAEDGLLQVDQVYWASVQAMLSLQTSVATREHLQQRLSAAERKFKARSLTIYEKTQVESALASAFAQEQGAWIALISTLNQMAALLDLPDDTIAVPDNYSEVLHDATFIDDDSLLKLSLAGNPALNSTQQDIRTGELVVKNTRLQLKPDINFVVSMDLSQTDRVLGYDDWTDSISHLFDPDNSHWFVGVRYTLPFGQHGLKAQKQAAKIQLSQNRQRVMLQEIELHRQVNQVIADKDTAKATLIQAERRLELADAAFKRSVEARGRGEISEFEFLQILDNQQAAKVDWILQLTSLQQVNSRALALKGSLAGMASTGGAQ